MGLHSFDQWLGRYKNFDVSKNQQKKLFRNSLTSCPYCAELEMLIKKMYTNSYRDEFLMTSLNSFKTVLIIGIALTYICKIKKKSSVQTHS